MKKLFKFGLILSIFFPSLSFSQNIQDKTDFEYFMGKFKSLKLPMKFPFDSIMYYNDYQKENTDGSIKTIKTKYVDISNSKYLPKFNYNKRDLKLKILAIYNYQINENFCAIIYNKSLDSDFPVEGLGDWLILCIYDMKGNMTDSLSIAGYTFESTKQSSEISKELKIKTQKFQDSPYDNKKKSYETKEILSEYSISKETGKILILKSESRKVKFNEETGLFIPLEPFKSCLSKQ